MTGNGGREALRVVEDVAGGGAAGAALADEVGEDFAQGRGADTADSAQGCDGQRFCDLGEGAGDAVVRRRGGFGGSAGRGRIGVADRDET